MVTMDNDAIAALKKASKKAYMDAYNKKNKEKFKLYNKERYKINRDKNLKYRKEYVAKNRDKVLESLRKFYWDNKEKRSKENKEWQKKNRDKVANYRLINADKIRKSKQRWHEKNKEKQKLRMADWVKNNPDKNCARVARRNAKLLQACPSWADMGAICKVYEEARRKQRQSGIPYHVDHIIPLQGKRVSGLHIAANLRPLPALENISKKNKFIEELVA